MANKDELKKQASDLNLTLTGEETKAELEALLESSASLNPPTQSPKEEKGEQMVPLSTVKQLIAEAMAAQAEKDKPQKVKRVTEHHAHVWRLNAKWVVDFADGNYDYEKKQVKDPYIKEKIHAYNVYNPEKREYEAWIRLIYDDGSMEAIALTKYINNRILVYCPILRREKVDKSYVIGEVEKKKEVGELNKGTGIMVDQEVVMDGEFIHVKTPEGKTLVLPDYVIC